jgi:hemerythrin-like metal-binding protein
MPEFIMIQELQFLNRTEMRLSLSRIIYCYQFKTSLVSSSIEILFEVDQMQLLKWDRELELGLEHIDKQHKQLFNIINELNIAIEYGQPNVAMLPLVERLQEFTNTHFKAEEEIFTKYCYTDRKTHEADHATFIDSIKYIRKQCELIDTPMSTKIRDFLVHWLCNHINTKDKEYKQFIDKNIA